MVAVTTRSFRQLFGIDRYQFRPEVYGRRRVRSFQGDDRFEFNRLSVGSRGPSTGRTVYHRLESCRTWSTVVEPPAVDRWWSWSTSQSSQSFPAVCSSTESSQLWSSRAAKTESSRSLHWRIEILWLRVTDIHWETLWVEAISFIFALRFQLRLWCLSSFKTRVI